MPIIGKPTFRAMSLSIISLEVTAFRPRGATPRPVRVGRELATVDGLSHAPCDQTDLPEQSYWYQQ